MSTIAFFGLGAMGEPMAEQLLKAGHEVHTSVHHSREAADRLAAAYGLKIFDTAEAAASGADYVITMLPDDPEVKAFLINDAFAASLKKGCCIIDMTSCTTEAICAVEAARLNGLSTPIQSVRKMLLFPACWSMRLLSAITRWLTTGRPPPGIMIRLIADRRLPPKRARRLFRSVCER